MQTSEHLHLVLPEQGYKALIHITDKIGQNGRPLVKTRWFETTDALTEAINQQPNTPRLYMGMAGFAEPTKREQDNARFIRSIYHDLDAGPEKYAKALAKHEQTGAPIKVYETQAQAVADMVRIAKLTGLVPTLINSSGMGLHVYWVLDRDYTVEEAQPVMLRVKAAFKALDVKSDPAVPGDTARVLRPVGSLHSVAADGTEIRVSPLMHKPTRVYTLDEINTAIEPHVPESVFLPKIQGLEEFAILNNDVLQYHEYNNSMAKGAEKCAALAELRDMRGQVEEPYWRLMIGHSTFCQVDGEDLRHEWSQGDKRYDEGVVEDYANRWKAGPPKCSSFAEHCDACHKCPFAGKITAPIQLCRVDAEFEVVEAAPEPQPVAAPAEVDESDSMDSFNLGPADEADTPIEESFDLKELRTSRPELFQKQEKVGTYYFKATENKTGWRLYARVLEETAGADGESVKVVVEKHIASRLFWFESCTMSTGDEESSTQIEMVVVLNPSSLRRQRFHVPASALVDNSAFAKAMLSRNVLFTHEDKSQHLTRKYMIMEYERIQNETRYAIRSRFGYDWFSNAGTDTFVCAYGDLLQYPGGKLERVMMNPALEGTKQHLLPGALPPSEKGSWDMSAYKQHIQPAAKKYAEFVKKHYSGPQFRDHRVAMAIGIGSAYLVFTDPGGLVPGGAMPANGGVVSLFSTETGKGKTALQNVIGAAFSAGKSLIGGDKSGATHLSRVYTASQLGVFPLLLDEVSQNDVAQQASEIQNFANGQARITATRTGGVRKPSNWSLVTVMSTNTSQVDLILNAEGQVNKEALLARILEIDFGKAPEVDPANSSYRNDFAEVSQYGGAIGMLLTHAAVTLGRNQMAELSRDEFQSVCEQFGMEQNSRFYGRMFAAALLANRTLARMGVNLFDTEDLVEGFRVCTQRLVGNLKVGRKTVEEHLGNMLDDFAKHIAVTTSWPSRGSNRAPTPLLNETNLQLPVVGREVKDKGFVMLRAKDVAQWCAKRRINHDKFIDSLRETNRLVLDGTDPVSKRAVTSGIPGIVAQPRCSVYTIDIRSTSGVSVAGQPPLASDEPIAVNE